MSPTQTTPLLGSLDGALYATVTPKCIAISQGRPTLVAEDYVVDIERMNRVSPVSAISTCAYSENRDMFYCDYCVQNNLQHFPESDPNWLGCMESEGSLVVLEYLISFQMRLLSVLVPLVLLFVVYLMVS